MFFLAQYVGFLICISEFSVPRQLRDERVKISYCRLISKCFVFSVPHNRSINRHIQETAQETIFASSRAENKCDSQRESILCFSPFIPNLCHAQIELRVCVSGPALGSSRLQIWQHNSKQDPALAFTR